MQRQRAKHSVVVWKSGFLINLKYLLVTLFYTFIHLYKSNFLVSSDTIATTISFNSFSRYVIIIMNKYFRAYNLFSSYGQFLISSKSVIYLNQLLLRMHDYKQLILER